MRPIRSLRLKFMGAISALVAVVLAANGVVQALASRRQLRQDIERRALSYAALAVGPVCEAFETYYASGYSKFRELLLETKRLDPDLDRLVIYDTGGRALFDSRELAEDAAPAAPAAELEPARGPLLQAIKGMGTTSWEATADERPVFVVVAPFVEEWGRHRYSVVFYVVYDGLRAAAKAAAWRIFWLTAGSLALGVLFAFALSAQNLVPLEILSRGARDLALGKLERRIDLATGDEFEVLAGTFNQMAQHLSTTISDLERSNRALAQMNLELQRLDRVKTDLLANVSHELRTPITAISAYTEAVDEGLVGQVNADQREALAAVKRNTGRLMRMIEQLLSYSRLEAGAAKMDFAPFDLRELALQVARTVSAGRGADCELRLDCPPELPPAWGDAAAIAQVLENLLTNAVKFTAPGGLVELRLRRAGEEIEVEVADQGIGIPAGELEKIFERFYQVDSSSTRRYGGMGLGLAIVREILAAHGRQAQVESAVGVGTTFRFSLAAAAAAPAEASRPAAAGWELG